MRTALATTVLWLIASPAFAGGGLDDFLARVNVQARADLGGFVARMSGQFGVPEAQVRVVLSAVSDPADAFMVFQIGQYCHRPSDEVLPVYRAHYSAEKGQGWGVIAKQMGIKPGSPEFHALKNGDLYFTGSPMAEGGGEGKGNGKAKGKGHGKP